MAGFIDTPILANTYGGDAAQQIAAVVASLEPVGRLGLADEVANSILFLASDDAGYINGANLLVDGGLSRLNTAVSILSGQVALA